MTVAELQADLRARFAAIINGTNCPRCDHVHVLDVKARSKDCAHIVAVCLTCSEKDGPCAPLEPSRSTLPMQRAKPTHPTRPTQGRIG